MINSPQENFYSETLDIVSAERQKIKTRKNLTTWLRVIIFFSGMVGLYIFTASHNSQAVVITCVFTVVLFLILVRYFSLLKNRFDYLSIKQSQFEKELQGLKGDYSGFDGAEEEKDAEHEFVEDIDFFGEKSVFQQINRSCTVTGRSRLARWFKNPEQNAQELRERQQAINELAEKKDLRFTFRATGMQANMKSDDYSGLLKWGKLPEVFNKPIFIVLPVVAILLSITGIILVSISKISFLVFIIYVFIGPLAFTSIYVQRITQRHNFVSRMSALFNAYKALFLLVEKEEFESDYLHRLQKELVGEKMASQAIHQLGKITTAIDSRLNLIMAFVLNGLFLWDIIQMVRLERWQRKYRDEIPVWFEALGTFDALCSLSGFAYNNPQYVMPAFGDRDHVMKATKLGHPLIPAEQRVCNDFSLDKHGDFMIITGANMAGKSTFLRTVAVNMILAMAGTVVCAQEMIFTPIHVITSLRTTDNLVRNESYFFAELKRLKWIIDKLNSGERLFIILDEILKGTNSKDKQEGSRALIEQLVRLKATGIIATHDIILGNLVKQYPDNIINRCFEVDIENDQLVFDYTLREGVSQNMNATFLMRRMGITV